MVESSKCLNCDTELISKFCHNCGQKADTHRITPKHFFLHDIVHGVWHLDKGILFTIKQVFVRPGNAAIDYIQGKRISYYNVFYLVLLLLGFNVIVTYCYDYLYEFMHHTKNKEALDTLGIMEFFNKYKKIILLAFIPFFAVNSFLLFRKPKLNFAEHVIISGMAYLLVVCLFTINNMLSLLEFTIFSFIYYVYDYMLLPLVVMYLFYTFYQAFGKYYKRNTIITKTIVFVLFVLIQMIMFITAASFYLIGKKGDTQYEITIFK